MPEAMWNHQFDPSHQIIQNMFKYVVFAALLAFAFAAPEPKPSVFAAAPLAYASPLAYSAYSTPYVASPYAYTGYPYAYTAYAGYASPYVNYY